MVALSKIAQNHGIRSKHDLRVRLASLPSERELKAAIMREEVAEKCYNYSGVAQLRRKLQERLELEKLGELWGLR